MVYLTFYKTDIIFNFSDNILKISSYLDDIKRDRISENEPLPILNCSENVFKIFEGWFNKIKGFVETHQPVIFNPSYYEKYDLNTLIEIFNFGLWNQIKLLCETIAYVIASRNVILMCVDEKYFINTLPSNQTLNLMVQKYIHSKIFYEYHPLINDIKTGFINHCCYDPMTDYIDKSPYEFCNFGYNDEYEYKEICFVSYSVTKMERYFIMCNTLRKIILPDSLEYLGCGNFMRCYRLEEIEIPDSVKEIGESCFDSCIELKRVKLGSKCLKIGDYCFKGCSKLTEITNVNEQIVIGRNAFKDCNSLHFELNNVLHKVPTNLTNYYVKNRVVASYAFENSEMTDVIISNCVENIQEYAFKNCMNLVNVEITDSTNVDKKAFFNCNNLTLTHQNILYNINKNLQQYIVPDGITKINYKAGVNSNLVKIHLPESLKEIDVLAFSNSQNLEEINISKDVKINYGAFENCKKLNINEDIDEFINYI